MRRNLRVCPTCGHHFPVGARERLDQLSEGQAWIELWPELRASDPLQFVDLSPYPDRVDRAEAAGGHRGPRLRRARDRRPRLRRRDHGLLRSSGGSMGSVVGEKLARACRPLRRAGPAAGRDHRLGRRPHAGGHHRPDADGQDRRRLRADARRRAAGHRGAGAPHHRRRLGVVRLARRRDLRRAGGADRLLGAARDRADHAREAAARLRPGRDPALQRPGRRRGGPSRAAGADRQGPGASSTAPTGLDPPPRGGVGPGRRRARGPRGPRPAGPGHAASCRPGAARPRTPSRERPARARRAVRAPPRRPPGRRRGPRRRRRSGRPSSSPATRTGPTRSTTSPGSSRDFEELHGDRLYGDDAGHRGRHRPRRTTARSS